MKFRYAGAITSWDVSTLSKTTRATLCTVRTGSTVRDVRLRRRCLQKESIIAEHVISLSAWTASENRIDCGLDASVYDLIIAALSI